MENVTTLEALTVYIRVIIKMLGIFSACALALAVLIGIGSMIYNRKKIVKILRRIATEY